MSVAAVLEQAIAEGATPGAAAAVLGLGGERLVVCRGHLHRHPRAPLVDENSIYDLASLTKLLSTTLICADAVAAGTVALNETPWPQWPSVSVRHMLSHSSGLPGWLPLFEHARRRNTAGRTAGADAVLHAALETAVEATPGTQTTYSDVGMIALGAFLAARLQAPLDVLFARCARAFGEHGLRFVRIDEDGYHPAVPAVAPTERCPWRRRVLHGQVHDENGYAMGGVAGHTGLFGSLLDMERAASFFLTAVKEPRSPLASTLAAFATAQGPRGLGFDKVTPGGSTGGVLSDQTVGHLGFTGTSLWIDPDAGRRGAAFVLLTNRINETRNNAIRQLRPAFHRAAMEWLQQR